MTRARRWLLAFAVSGIVMAAQSPLSAEESAVVGYLEGYAGDSGNYAIDRNNDRKGACPRQGICAATDREGLHPLTPLYAEDRIVFCSDEGAVTVLLADGDRQTLKPKAGEHCLSVENRRKEPRNLWDVLLLNLARSFGMGGSGDLVMARVKGEDDDAPSLPMLFHRRPRVVAGERDFSVAWAGGKAPFEVRVLRKDDGAVVLERSGLAERHLPPAKAALAPGRYGLTVTDAKAASATVSFSAVDAGKLPQPPTGLVPEGFPPEIRRLAESAWIAQQADGRWMLEAYLRASAGDRDYQPAQALRATLRLGEVPGP